MVTLDHPAAYKTCGIMLLLLATLQIFFVLDFNTPVWVKVCATILIIIASFVPMVVFGGGEASIFGKFLIYLSIGSGGLLILTFFFAGLTKENGGLITPENYPAVWRFSLFFLGAYLNALACFVALLLTENRLSVSIAIVSGLCFGVMYFIPGWPLSFISIPYGLSGIAYLTMRT